MALIIFSEPIVESIWVRNQDEVWGSKEKADSILAQWDWRADSVHALRESSVELFSFDPNSVTHEQMELLGFSERVRSRIINYRNKNGKFRVKSDLLKIYGMDSVLYNTLVPYIILPERLTSREPIVSTPKKIEITTLVDLNSADSISLIRVNGIGPKLSQRIISYRKKLGGFVSMDQLHEVYGLDSAVIKRVKEKFEVVQPSVMQLSINSAPEAMLMNHPYIGRKIAKAIVAYRFQHGPFQRIEDLLRIQAIDEQAFSKMKPYLSL